MDKKKSQHYNFCYEAIPALFHTQTKDFMKLIERDGLKFLEFWWNHIGDQLPEEKLVAFTHAAFEIVDLEMKPPTKVVFVTLPMPQEEGEMYFLGLVRKPERKFGWLRLPSTRILCLVKRSKDRYASGTELGDLTPRAIVVPIGEGPAASLGEFKRKVIEMVLPKDQG
jgi:hypothetical protein